MLTWMILLFTNFPDKQRKFHEEIESVVGTNRRCTLSNRPKMPYTEAVAAETLRFGTALQGISHRAMQDTQFKGFAVKKETLIMPNFYWICFNLKVWADPDIFRPERFLDPSTGWFKRSDNLLPFSTGRRACIGETPARYTLLLFSTNLFQKFNIRLDTLGPQNGLKAVNSIVRFFVPSTATLVIK